MGGGTSQIVQTYDEFVEISTSYFLNFFSNTIANNGRAHDDNLETFSLLWLDAEVNTTVENQLVEQELRQIINHLKTFDDLEQCYEHILSIHTHDRIVLIVSGQLGRQLVPRIHQLRQISSIYVFCRDREGNERWTKDFPKVKSVIVQLDKLIEQIRSDQKHRLRVEEPLSIEVFKVIDQSTTQLNGHLVHFLLLIDVLIRIPSCSVDRRQLIARCEEEYKDNKPDLDLVHEFQSKYSPNRAVWWYTRESFVYRMLNKALRMQNIDLLFLFRFVIGDIYRQLQQNQCRELVRVYRGQVMSDEELSTLRRLKGEFISINSFFSTSFGRQQAIYFLDDAIITKGLHRVLFEINADPGVVTSRPFADITDLSALPDEGEVLFMAGCVFRLIDIRRDNNDQLWVIQMNLCGDNDYGELKKLFDHLKREYGGGDGQVNLHFFGDVLHQMGKFDLAENTYRRSLAELPVNDPSVPHLYRSLGLLMRTKAKYDDSLEWFRHALDDQLRIDPSNHIDIADLHKQIGIIYSDKNNHTKALECYTQAVELLRQAPNENQLELAQLYHNTGVIYKRQGRYAEALDIYQTSLYIKNLHLPAHHPSIAMSHNDIGNVYLHIDDCDNAMKHYKESLDIRMKSLPPQHPDIAMSYRNIGLVHEKRKKRKKALEYFEKSATIYRQSFASRHENIIRIESDIQRASKK